jgi:hypothetical protein
LRPRFHLEQCSFRNLSRFINHTKAQAMFLQEHWTRFAHNSLVCTEMFVAIAT